jgi:hypothetical protein
MSNAKANLSKIQDKPFGPQQVLQWAMCHPGVLLLSSLAVGAVLVHGHEIKEQAPAERRRETEADIVDGDIPLFI